MHLTDDAGVEFSPYMPWSGKQHHHGGDWPLWTSPSVAGPEHDTICARTGRAGLRPIKNTHGVALSIELRTINALHSATRALAERGNSLLKTTFKVLRRVSPRPWRIGVITAAALVLLHHTHDRTNFIIFLDGRYREWLIVAAVSLTRSV